MFCYYFKIQLLYIIWFSKNIFNPFRATDLVLYPLKTSENQRLSNVFRWYRKRPLTWHGLRLYGYFTMWIEKYSCYKIISEFCFRKNQNKWCHIRLHIDLGNMSCTTTFQNPVTMISMAPNVMYVENLYDYDPPQFSLNVYKATPQWF